VSTLAGADFLTVVLVCILVNEEAADAGVADGLDPHQERRHMLIDKIIYTESFFRFSIMFIYLRI